MAKNKNSNNNDNNNYNKLSNRLIPSRVGNNKVYVIRKKKE